MTSLSPTALDRRRLAPAVAVLLVAGLASPVAAATRPPSAGDTVVRTASSATVSPGVDLGAAMKAMHAGDVLRLAPGIYDVGVVQPMPLPSGTPNHPITLTAADRANPPVLRGALRLFRANYWNITYLRVHATVPGQEAIYLGGGVGWKVSGNEFTGAKNTGAYANVTISSPQNSPSQARAGGPESFRFSRNCVHDAALTARDNQDHNVYVNFAGNDHTSGSIDHNLIFNHRNGAGVKLGYGGTPGALGPWGVAVTDNTIVEGGRQILLHGNVVGNTIRRNILASSREPFHASPKTTAIYANRLTNRTNTMDHNYVWNASMVLFDSARAMRVGADNALRANPGFRRIGSCAGYGTSSAAVHYGRHGR